MPITLFADSPDFEPRFAAFLTQKRENDPDVVADVAAILAQVAADGDAALVDMTRRYDGFDPTATGLAFSKAEIAAAIANVPDDQRAALELAAERIRDYHARQLPRDESWTDAHGAELGWRWTPVDVAGLYVPGGLASYPSSVLMNAIPAKVAGVEKLVVTAPTPKGKFNPLVLLAAELAGVDHVFRIGGAQAIGAMAYGTATVPRADIVTGPGNAFVAAAKRQVFGQVGIDMIAGPSEILVIADDTADPDWIALDLMSQAEHDESAQAILITDSVELARSVAGAVDARLQTLERRAVAEASWRDFGAIIVVGDMDQAARLSDRIAPEHLELCTQDPDALLRRVRHAGAIFLGSWTPEAIGDYVGGPNHVLPTARSARFASGLSVLDFMKRTTIARMTPASLKAVGPAAETLARSEGLEAHGLSVTARLERLNQGADDD